MNKTYFKYLLSSKKNLLGFLGIINLLFPAFIYFILISNEYSQNTAFSCINTAVFIVFLECIVLPMMYFSFIDNKNGVDTYFSLPIRRKEMFITTYIMIVSAITITHLFSTSFVFISEIFISETLLYPIYYVLYAFGCIFAVAVIVLGVCALILKTNSILDAFITVGFYLSIPLLLFSCVYMFIDTQAYALNPYGFLSHFLSHSFLPIVFMYSFPSFAALANGKENLWLDCSAYSHYFIALLIVGIIAAISFAIDIKKRKAENAQQISNHPCTFPFIILTTTLTLLLDVIFANLQYSIAFILLSIIFVFYLIMICIYKRKITFDKKYILCFVAMLVFGYATLLGSVHTNAYGLDYSYRNLTQLKTSDLTYSFDMDDDTSYHIQIRSDVNDISKEIKEGNQSELIKHLNSFQDDHLNRYYNHEIKQDYEGNAIYSSMLIEYVNEMTFQYHEFMPVNNKTLHKIRKEYEFYKNCEFYNCQIIKSYIDEEGDYLDKGITFDTFANEVLSKIKE